MPFKRKAQRGKQLAVVQVEEPSEEPSAECESFQTDRAKEKFANFTSKRNLWPERGFVYETGPTLGYPEYIYSVILKHNWKYFCQHPSAAIKPLVQEFYANFDCSSPDSVFVRGKRVDVTGAAINNLLKLDDVEDEYLEFSESLDEDQLNEVLGELCIEGASWTKSTHGSRTLLRSDLQPGPMLWNIFLKSRLLPSTHDHTVNQDRAVLLYAIIEGRNINVGQLVSAQISKCASKFTKSTASKNQGSLWFPSLITSLCLEQGVPMLSGEKRLAHPGAITMNTIRRVLQDRSRAPAKLAPASAPRKSGQPSQPAAASSSRAETPEELLNSIRLLEQRVSLQEIHQQETLAMLQQLHQHQQKYWAYAKGRDCALRKSLQKNFTKPTFQFPEFPEDVFTTLFSHDAEQQVEEPEAETREEEAEPAVQTPEEEELIPETQAPEVQAPEPPTAATTKRAKGKAKVGRPPAPKRMSLRSAASRQ